MAYSNFQLVDQFGTYEADSLEECIEIAIEDVREAKREVTFQIIEARVVGEIKLVPYEIVTSPK